MNIIPSNTADKGCEGLLQELQTTAQGNKMAQIEKHSMFMVRKNQYRENGHTTQSNLQIHCYPHQASPMTFFTELEKNHLKLHMKPKEPA